MMNKITRRAIAFYIDHAVIVCLMFVIAIPGCIFESRMNKFALLAVVIAIFALFSLYFLKDLKNGQSIGKRIMKLKVVDENKKTPTKYKLIIRNITIFIWVVEAVLVLFDKKRIGDILAGTDVIETL